MRVSLLVPTYRDIRALELILNALKLQTYQDFEVIVAEDDNSEELKDFIKGYKSQYPIFHVFHENLGNRKAIIMNKALKESNGEYIIFIDGDTIPYTTFIESHVALAKKRVVLCGRRVNLGNRVSTLLREGKIEADELEKHYLRYYRLIKNDNSRHYEQGLYFKANGTVQRMLMNLNKNVHIVASNFSCFREDIFAVNGFDEDLPYAPHRDDTDLEWRMVGLGCGLLSVKYCANMFHLNHSRNDRKVEESENMRLILEKQERKEFIAKNGIIKS